MALKSIWNTVSCRCTSQPGCLQLKHVCLSAYTHNLSELLSKKSHTCHISSYQDGDPLFLKFRNDLIPLALVHVPMEQPQVMILLLEVIGQLLCVGFLGDKEENAPRGRELHEAPRQPVPLAGPRGENLHNLSDIFICLRGEMSSVRKVGGINRLPKHSAPQVTQCSAAHSTTCKFL